jgi:hypothetical protein
MRRLPLLVVTLALTLPAALVDAGDWSGDQDLAKRLKQLEEETQSLRSEVDYLREHPVRLPAADSTDAQLMSTLAEPPVDATDYFSLDEIKTEMKKLVWGKGDFHIVPYGILWGDMIYASRRTVPGQFILWVESEEKQGEDSFIIDARRSRVGIDVKGPTVGLFGGITGGGKVEVDFFGTFVTANQPAVRLRHVYWEAKNDDVRFLVGQTWDLISPLLPSTVNFSVGWAAGNVGFRRTQFRIERYFHVTDDIIWTVEGALAQDVIQDFTGGSTAADIIREPVDWPIIQGRTAVTFGNAAYGDLPVTLGVSGHIGETGFDFLDGFPANPALGPEDDARFQTWSMNADVKVPVTDRLRFQGEFFTGANLSNILGGIVQGVCPCLRVPIRATGGWAEVSYDLNPCLQTNVGFGIDDPNDADSLIGRTYNRFIYTNLWYKLTPRWRTGFEVSVWRTSYHNRTDEPGFTPIAGPTEPGRSVVLDWTTQYRF